MEIVLSQSGHPIPVIKSLPLHSRINPLKEGPLFLKPEETGKSLIVIGLGFAYHLSLALEQKQKILVIEPDETLVQAFFKFFPETSLTIYSKSVTELPGFLEQFFQETAKNIVIKTHQPSFRARPGFYEPFAKAVKIWQEQSLLNLITDSAFGPLWTLNTLKNLRLKPQAPVFKNDSRSPVVILGSGYSLLKAIPILKKISRQVVIAAIPPLLEILHDEKISPDFVFLADPGHANRHYLGIKNNESIPLLTYLNASNLFIRNWKGPVYFFNSGLPLDQLLIPEFPTFPSSGSVANTLLRLAEFLAPETGMAGFDFSFVKGYYHYPGNPLETALLFQSSRYRTLETSQVRMTYPPSSVWLSGQKDKIRSNTAMASYYQDFYSCLKNYSKPCRLLSPETVLYPDSVLLKGFSDSLPGKYFNILPATVPIPWKERLTRLRSLYASAEDSHPVLRMHLTRFFLKTQNPSEEREKTLKKIDFLLSSF